MAPRPTADELWGSHLMPPSLVVSILMPNGLLLDIECYRESTLDSIKSKLWKEAKNHVLYRLLGQIDCYIFVTVTQDSKIVEFYDESRRLCDLRLFQPILQLVEPVGNKEEKVLSSEISLAIGRPVNEFDNLKDNELIDFRFNLLTSCQKIVETRNSLSISEQTDCYFPPELDEIEEITKMNDNHAKKHWTISCWFPFESRPEKFNVTVPQNCKPDFVVFQTLKDAFKFGNNQNRDEQEMRANDFKDDFVLKVCEMEQYLLGNRPLFKYKYIANCISQGNKPKLMLVKKNDLYSLVPKSTFLVPSFLRRNPQQSPSTTMSLWNVESMLRVNIVLATYVNVKDVNQIYVKVGVYHGPDAICQSKQTKSVEPQKLRWDETLEFDLYVPDIPRSAKLCFSICAVNFRKKREETCAIAWGNVQLFDYKSYLLNDRVNINLWPMPKGHDELLNPLGVVGSNPNKESSCLQVQFDRFSHQAVYPSIDEIHDYGQFVNKLEKEKKYPQYSNNSQTSARYESQEMTQVELLQIQEILKRDPLSELSEQEKDLLWKSRRHLLTMPNSLPKLLDSVKWNSRDEISQLYCLLENWPKVNFETALELLDCKYADLFVRNFAVKCLDENLKDELLLQFLLQLVQVLKKEPYLNNELSHFLLRRALMNQKVGHVLFWHLKSEINDPLYSNRCGILLEAFCRGLALDSLKSIAKQVDALEKLEKLSDILKERKDDTPKDRLKFLHENLKKDDYLEVLQHLQNPINSNFKLGKLLIEECKIMESAKRPLWLVWSNSDVSPDADQDNNDEKEDPKLEIIFKNGDDLRQDMLTLQVIRIMDMIWRKAKLDLKMSPYTCLATGKQVGMIEVVKNANTVMNIQRFGGKLAALQVNYRELFKWIKEKNKDNCEKAVDHFMKSCAGYCVATFILGIGDRNPDNIMINEEGQIFHIDFGHFLGHFKKKFGINRERVPFVLTSDFLYVITKGSENPLKSKEFETFVKLCGDAYLALHENANLLITLFTMMLSTGIPELQSMDDIAYLRQTLQVERSRDEALKYFGMQLNEAHGGAWSTKLDWFFHCLRHNSKPL